MIVPLLRGELSTPSFGAGVLSAVAAAAASHYSAPLSIDGFPLYYPRRLTKRLNQAGPLGDGRIAVLGGRRRAFSIGMTKTRIDVSGRRSLGSRRERPSPASIRQPAQASGSQAWSWHLSADDSRFDMVPAGIGR
jgi:hypothetical protein